MLVKKMKPYISKKIQIGNIILGGKKPTIIQSMCNTPTNDIEKSVRQSIQLFEAGCQMVRLTVPSVNDVRFFEQIKNRLIQKGYTDPLVADVHFNSKVAEMLVGIADKIRINPGNYADKNTIEDRIYTNEEYSQELSRVKERFLPLVEACKKQKTAIRIGVNHGSLSTRILNRYGNSPQGMVESAMEFARICKEVDFYQVVVSMKSGNPAIMIESTALLAETMTNENLNYPIHLGVTESGSGIEGRIKSTVGIANILARGIGDTIRVSLTESPVKEISVCKKIIDFVDKSGLKGNPLNIPDHFTSNTKMPKSLFRNYHFPIVISQEKDNNADLFLNDEHEIASSDFKPEKLSGNNFNYIKLDALNQYQSFWDELLDAEKNGKPTFIEYDVDNEDIEQLHIGFAASIGIPGMYGLLSGIIIGNNTGIKTERVFDLLQACGKRITKTEYISCPGCGRTNYDLEAMTEAVKSKTAHFKGLKIAVMGCIVNGPGEMADADYGYVGSGKGKVTLYKGKSPVKKNVLEKNAVDELIDLIEKNL